MNGRLLTKTSFSIIWSETYEARDQKYRSDDAQCLDGILRSHNAAQVRYFPNISGCRNCSWGKYKECIQKETNTFSQLLWSGLAGIAALCSGVGAGEVKGAALGHHQQNKPAPCLHREDRFFNNESKILKERERGSCTTPRGGNVPMGLSVFTVFTPSALHLLTLARTFSNEAGLTSEKQMRKTSWWGKTENNP